MFANNIRWTPIEFNNFLIATTPTGLVLILGVSGNREGGKNVKE
jgi:hypothetical protein